MKSDGTFVETSLIQLTTDGHLPRLCDVTVSVLIRQGHQERRLPVIHRFVYNLYLSSLSWLWVLPSHSTLQLVFLFTSLPYCSSPNKQLTGSLLSLPRAGWRSSTSSSLVILHE